MVNDFKYRIGSFTNILGRPPKFYHSALLRQAGCTFSSVYAVRAEDAEAIECTAGTAAGFKGIVWSQRLWVDFDTEEGAVSARKLLKEEGYDYVEYNTGGRGAHFGILRPIQPSHVLPSVDRLWVSTNMPEADLSLYWHLHLIRLPGTVHERTGKRKTLVDKISGKPLILSQHLPSAEASRDSAREGISERKGIFSLWSVVSNLTGTGLKISRHRHLVNLAIALQKDAGLTEEEALWMCLEVNRGFEEPKDSFEVEKIVRWTYGKQDK